MVENRVHRIWIVASEETEQLIGVVSQSDVLAALLGLSYHFDKV